MLDDAQFTVRGVSPNESRDLLFLYPQKRLGAHIEIANGNEAPLTVRLQPCAMLIGRVISADGHPVPGRLFELHASNSRRNAGFLTENKRAQTDKDGNFRIEGVIPDLEYNGRVGFKGLFSVKLKPAETYDAQTIRLAQKLEGREGPGGTASGKTNASTPGMDPGKMSWPMRNKTLRRVPAALRSKRAAQIFSNEFARPRNRFWPRWPKSTVIDSRRRSRSAASLPRLIRSG